MELSLNQLAEKMSGTIIQGAPSQTFNIFNIDSRETKPGELFFAITAERDGHNFIPHAQKKGAGGAVISKPVSLPHKNFALIKVQDTVQALQQLAQKVLSKHQVKIAGITGSTGKTTTKEFASSLLSISYKVLKSQGNYNNYLGLPLSILQLQKEHQLAVLEMGISQPGEMETLTKIAPPDVSVITNIKPVHLEFFKNIEEIASAKKKILEGMNKNSTAVLNGDDWRVKKIARQWKGSKLFFGLSSECEIRATQIHKSLPWGITFILIYKNREMKITIPFLYEIYLYNFLAATAAAVLFSVPLEKIQKKAQKLKPVPGRGVIYKLSPGITVVDDTYNSNPGGLESVLKGLSSFPSQRKVVVLGDMLELGEKEVEYHLQAGKQVVHWGWDILITVGPLSKHMAEGAREEGLNSNQIFCFSNSEEAAQEINSLVKENDLILIKGSRGIKTEKILEKLKKDRT